MGLNNRIYNLKRILNDLTPKLLMRPHVWCTNYQFEGCHTTKCPQLKGTQISTMLMGDPPPLHSVGVLRISLAMPFFRHAISRADLILGLF